MGYDKKMGLRTGTDLLLALISEETDWLTTMLLRKKGVEEKIQAMVGTCGATPTARKYLFLLRGGAEARKVHREREIPQLESVETQEKVVIEVQEQRAGCGGGGWVGGGVGGGGVGVGFVRGGGLWGVGGGGGGCGGGGGGGGGGGCCGGVGLFGGEGGVG